MSLNARKDIGLAVNVEKPKHSEVTSHRGMMANEHITVASNSYGKAKTLKYLGFLVTNQTSNHKEIKCRPKAGNPCYYFCLLEFSLRI